jgi:hypothetical protein
MWRLAIGMLATGKPELIGARRGMDQTPALDLFGSDSRRHEGAEAMHHGA